MAEADSTSVPATDAASGSSSNLVQLDVDTLKWELTDLKTKFELLTKRVDDLAGPKVEEVPLVIPPANVVIKHEPPELQLGDGSDVIPATPQDDADDVDEEAEANEQNSTGLSRRQSTEEPRWTTPLHGEVLFRVNPEYARRLASPNRVVVPESARVPTPPVAREETPPPPPPPRSFSPPPAAHPTDPIPTSQPKRKYTFELVFEARPKRFKPSLSTSTAPPDRPTASSSRDVSDESVVVVARSPPRKYRTGLSIRPIIRGVTGPSFDVALNPQTRNVLATRAFLKDRFGAHFSHSFTIPPQPRINEHGYDHFAFVGAHSSVDHTPSAPGKPGIITQFRENPWPARALYRIFVRSNVAPARWQYMGLYTARRLKAWSPAEVKRHGHTVKTSWARRARDSMWGRPIIARILLRRELGREPTEAEVKVQITKLDGGSSPLPPLGVITAAFERGEEKLYPWKLVCKGYEEKLQWEIAISSPRFEREALRKSKASEET